MSDASNAWMDGDSRPLSAEQRLQFDGVTERAPLSLAMVIPASIALDVLRQAFDETCRGHDIFTARIASAAGFRGLRWLQDGDAGAQAVEWRMSDDDAPLNAPMRVHWQRIDDIHARLTVKASPLRLDAASLAAIVAEALTRATGGAIARDDEPFQYGQLLEWRESLEDDEDRPRGIAYWRDYLESADPDDAVALPYRRSIISEPASNSMKVRTSLTGADASRWFDFCRANGNHAGDALQCAWWMLLARISGQSRQLVAAVHDCRDDYEPLAGALGAYRRVLPVSLELQRDATLESALTQWSGVFDAHRQCQECCPVDAGSFKPFLRASFESVDAPAWPVGEIASFDTAGSPCELAMFVGTDTTRDRIDFSLAYDVLRYDEASVRVLLDQYITLLTRLPSHANASIARLPLENDTSRERSIAWRGPDRDFNDTTVLATLERHASETPEAPAIAADDLMLDYAGLWAAIETGARNLAARGVCAGDIVGIAMPRSGRQVLALLSAMRAGAAYLPIDPEWPNARREAIIASAKPRLVIDALDHGANHVSDKPLPPISADDRAYVIFTSGSTGAPKGVPITHGALLNYAASVSEAAALDRCRVFALTSTVAADLGNTALYGAIYTGGCLAVASRTDTADAAAFARFLSARRVDCVKFVPSHLDALLGDTPMAVPATVILGGEAARPALLRKLRAAAPEVRIFNHYGPTETTIGVLIHEVPAHASSDADATHGLPLTRVLANCVVRLLHADGEPTPVGAAGELCIGGRQLSAGYLDHRATTAFVADAASGERFYCTGDLARRLPDGGLLWLGRADDQVKIRGYRIEPGEIGAACLNVPGVAQAVVMAVGDAETRRLAAYIVATPGAKLDATTLRRALEQTLPEPMVPSHVIVIDTLPRLANGKIDRRALPPPGNDATGGEEIAPETGVETVLAQVAADLLGRERVGVTDDFFALGGDSLLVIRFVSRITESLRVEVLPGMVFANPNVRALAEALRSAEAAPGALERMAQARMKLDAMSPEARAALLAKARSQAAGADVPASS